MEDLNCTVRWKLSTSNGLPYGVGMQPELQGYGADLPVFGIKITAYLHAGLGTNHSCRLGLGMRGKGLTECAYRCGCCCNLFSTIRYCRRNGRMRTLIRHAGPNPASPIPALAVAMIQSSFCARLVTTVGGTALPPPRRCAASHAAIALPPVTVRTNGEQHVAGAPQTEPRPQNRLAMYIHAPGVRALTTAIRSWEVRTSFDVWLTFP